MRSEPCIAERIPRDGVEDDHEGHSAEAELFDIDSATRDNSNYRSVVWSGRYLQVTLMSIPVDGDIDLEMHTETDQFIRLEAGRGVVQMGASKDQLTVHSEVSDGWCVLVPAGTWHNITNTGTEPMQIYTLYAPAHHARGRMQRTAADAAADKGDMPAKWSVQPVSEPADQHS